MDGRLTRTNCDAAGDYVVPDVLSPRDLVSRPDNMDETVLSSSIDNPCCVLDVMFMYSKPLKSKFKTNPIEKEWLIQRQCNLFNTKILKSNLF